MTRIPWIGLPLTVLLLLGGCTTTKPVSDQAMRDKMLALLMPAEIEIVEPFTRVKSFDDDPTPDGVELWLQAVNSLGNKGLNLVGTVRAELYEYVPASAEHKGRRLEQWQIELVNTQQQRTYFSHLTQMYEFRLTIDPSNVPAARQYVLTVTYNSPLGEHLTDECVIIHHPEAGFAGTDVGESG